MKVLAVTVRSKQLKFRVNKTTVLTCVCVCIKLNKGNDGDSVRQGERVSCVLNL